MVWVVSVVLLLQFVEVVMMMVVVPLLTVAVFH
jgi:hypothetical protein